MIDRCGQEIDCGHVSGFLPSTSVISHPVTFPLCTLFSALPPSPFSPQLHLFCFFSRSLPLFSRIVGGALPQNGILGNVALKAFRIPEPSQRAVPHGDIAASKPQIFPFKNIYIYIYVAFIHGGTSSSFQCLNFTYQPHYGGSKPSTDSKGAHLNF